MFVSTRASDYVMECLQKNSCVTLIGSAGVGKSFICRHTALLLQQEGYKIIPVYPPTDIRDYYQPGKQTVFIVDDICGNFTANESQIENWKQLLPVVDLVIADRSCKIIVSCRLQVYKDDKFNILVPFKSCECYLTSDKLCLTSVEKHNIAKAYIGTSIIDIDVKTNNSDFFPLLCSLYHDKKNVDVNEFFNKPFDFYKNELDKLSEHGDEGNYKLCSLALCVLFNNKLEETWFEGKVTDAQRQIIEDTCNACKINRSTSKAKLKNELDTLDGTFICKQKGIYRTIHDKLFDFLAHYFGQKMIGCLIDHGDSDLVHQRFIWQKSLNDKTGDIDFIITVSDDNLESYLQKFIKDWLAGKVTVVFSNNNMKVSSFRQKLLENLKLLDNSMQVTLANTKDTVLPKKNCGSGNTPLVHTCYNGYTYMVQWIIDNAVVVDQCRDDGVSGLLMASQNGHTDIVKLLLEKDSNVNLYDKDGRSPLLMASHNGHSDIVKLLLEKDSTVNLYDKDGRSPLLMASRNGHTDIVKLLLEKNYNVNLYDKDGRSPLLMASQNGHTDIVKLLLEKNYNVNLYDKDGRSPLLMASLNGRTDIVKLLLEKDYNINLYDKYGRSPLLMASQNGHTDIVKLLLEKNPNVNLCNNDGWSPLIYASLYGHTDIVRLLLEWNPGPCNKTPLSTSYVNNSTSITYISNSAIVVQPIMRHNSDVNAQTCDGGNALYFTAFYGNKEITKLLLENDADCNICTFSKQFQTETYTKHPTFTLEHGIKQCFDDLIDHASAHVKDYVSQKALDYVFDVEANCSPLHIACFMGRKDVVSCLLDYNANINMTKEDGTTPLFYACEVGHAHIVHLLLEKGADTQMCRQDEKFPLDIATDNGHTSIVMILTEHMKERKHCPI